MSSAVCLQWSCMHTCAVLQLVGPLDSFQSQCCVHAGTPAHCSPGVLLRWCAAAACCQAPAQGLCVVRVLCCHQELCWRGLCCCTTAGAVEARLERRPLSCVGCNCHAGEVAPCTVSLTLCWRSAGWLAARCIASISVMYVPFCCTPGPLLQVS